MASKKITIDELNLTIEYWGQSLRLIFHKDGKIRDVSSTVFFLHTDVESNLDAITEMIKFIFDNGRDSFRHQLMMLFGLHEEMFPYMQIPITEESIKLARKSQTSSD